MNVSNNETLIIVFGSLMTYSFMLCFAPQIFKMFKNKSSRDVSGGMCLLQILGNIGGLGLAFLQSNDFWFKLNYSIGLLMAFSVTYFWWLYRINITYGKRPGGCENRV